MALIKNIGIRVRQFLVHNIPPFMPWSGSFAVQYRDHFRGPGSFAVQLEDHLQSWGHLQTRTDSAPRIPTGFENNFLKMKQPTVL